MKQQRDIEPAKRQNSPVGWAIGVVFVIAIAATVFIYDGRDFGHRTTTTTPNAAPSVMNGSNKSGSSN